MKNHVKEEVDIYNPYAKKIDLLSSKGRKLYTRSTKGLDNDHKYNMSEGAEDFFGAIIQASERFCWGDVVENIGINWDLQGKPRTCSKIDLI